ncbi:phage tail terminator protein [Vibrio mediterranei]
MSLIKMTADHLRKAGSWRDVRELDALSELDVQSSGARYPVLFVFPVGESPKPDVRGSGPYLQDVVSTVGVLIVDKKVNGRKKDMDTLRRELRKALFGFSPSQEYEPFWLGAGKLLNVSRGTVTWLDNFVTEYTEDQRDYGS